MRARFLIPLVLAAALTSCGKPSQPRHIVILPDVSGSIDRKALEQTFQAIDQLAGGLHRGDAITIIPILSDAGAEASGRILRFEVPLNRQAYDSELRNFRGTLKTALEQMMSDAFAHPASKTDILGSFALAEQEFEGSHNSRQLLIVLSDFIQEDKETDFRTDVRLENVAAMKKFAIVAAERHAGSLKATHIYLGLLRSREYAALSPKRRDAIGDFWMEYSKALGGQPQSVTDGAGLMKSCVRNDPRNDEFEE